MAKKQYFIESELVFKEKPKHLNFQDLEGQKFGRLTVIGFAGVKGSAYWYCKCDCGFILKFRRDALITNKIESCGCLKVGALRKHVCTSKIYKIWCGMIRRCELKNHYAYKYYGGRGITVCERWQTFENFFSDMGEKPEGLSLDRIDNNGNYCPENCRWATMKEQANNKRDNRLIEYNGNVLNITQWAELLNISRHRIFQRLNSGWDTKRALTTSVRSKKKSRFS